jgi:hypothetical protein
MTSRLVLVIGDLHIPDRALDIPAKASRNFPNPPPPSRLDPPLETDTLTANRSSKSSSHRVK